jgi:hypothetical protein
MSTALLCVGLIGGPGCERQQPLATAPQGTAGTAAPIVVAARVASDRAGSGTLEFIHDSFEQLYPWLLVRHSMPAGEKASLWHKRYNGRWVRWSGMVMSVTPNGLTMKLLATTTTYDVSVWLDADALARSRSLKKGDRVTFVGRLDAYDDVLRHVLVTHGTIVGNPDLGAGAPLPSIPPELLRPPPGTTGGGPNLAPPTP